MLTSLRGGGKGKGGKGKGKGKGRAKEDSGVPDEPQMSSTERQHAGEHEFEQDSNSDGDALLEDDVGVDVDGVLDVMARFRGEKKKDCKFIIVTGEYREPSLIIISHRYAQSHSRRIASHLFQLR